MEDYIRLMTRLEATDPLRFAMAVCFSSYFDEAASIYKGERLSALEKLLIARNAITFMKVETDEDFRNFLKNTATVAHIDLDTFLKFVGGFSDAL